MKTKILYIGLLLSISFPMSVNAISLANRWTMLEGYNQEGTDYYVDTDEIYVVKDSMLEGYTYQVLSQYGMIRYENDGTKSYFRLFNQDNDYLLFDFNLNKGDTCLCFMGAYNNPFADFPPELNTAGIDALSKWVIIDKYVTHDRQIMDMKLVGFDNHVKIVEGVGSEYFPFLLPNGFLYEGGASHYAICAFADEELLYSFDMDSHACSPSIVAHTHLRSGMVYEELSASNNIVALTDSLYGDTIVEGKHYLHHKHAMSSVVYNTLWRDDTTGMYVYFMQYQKEFLVYPYGVQVGDSIYISLEDLARAHDGALDHEGTLDWGTKKVIVCDVDTIVSQNGEQYRRIHYTKGWRGNKEQWFIEGIGSLYNGLWGENGDHESSYGYLYRVYNGNTMNIDVRLFEQYEGMCNEEPSAVPVIIQKDVIAPSKFLQDGHLYIIVWDGMVYDAVGGKW